MPPNQSISLCLKNPRIQAEPDRCLIVHMSATFVRFRTDAIRHKQTNIRKTRWHNGATIRLRPFREFTYLFTYHYFNFIIAILQNNASHPICQSVKYCVRTTHSPHLMNPSPESSETYFHPFRTRHPDRLTVLPVHPSHPVQRFRPPAG